MKKNLNVIQIRGIKGLIILGMALCCLFVGFIVFPGWLAMHLWNFLSLICNNAIPSIGIIQGVLLWGIIIASYFIFKKEKIVVCVKSPKGLSEEELKTVFADIKKKDDKIVQAMLKARETELQIQELEQEKTEIQTNEQQSDEINKHPNL